MIELCKLMTLVAIVIGPDLVLADGDAAEAD